MEFKDRLKELRLKAGLTKTELAKAISVSYSTICSWEKGLSQPKLTALIALVDYFAVSCNYLVGLNTAPKRK